MTAPMGEPRTGRRPVRRRFVPADMGRAKVALPNGLTLGNLFFGINAIIAASRGDFDKAVLFVVLGGVCDAFDGAAARATRTGGRFGEELDSLVDAISFGLAPAMIVHFSTLVNGGTGWNWAVFIFAACAVMRLARFNVTQAGASKTYFQGLPSPAAGGTVATYYWFSQTSFYQNNEAIVGLPWGVVMQWLMIILGWLMISSVPYPAWPKVGLRSLKGVLGLAAILFILFGIGYWRRAFFFPFGIAYVTYGLVRAGLLGLWERRPRRDAYTGAPLPPRRGTPRGMSALPVDAEELEASYLDADDLAVEEEYDFFDDDEAAAPTAARRSGAMRAVRPDRADRAERPPRDAAERADRAERLERRKKRKKKERAERQARGESPTSAAGAPSPGLAPAAERGERPPREPRPPREARPPRDVVPRDAAPRDAAPRGGAVEPMDGADAGAPLGDEETDGSEEGDLARDASGRPDGERRKRRKRRRGNRAANGESPAGGAPGPERRPDAALGGTGGGERAGVDTWVRDTVAPASPPAAPPGPVTPPAPVAPPPAPPSTPPPTSSPDFREDRSE